MVVTQVIELVTIGVVLAYAGGVTPKKLVCDGSAISRSVYSKLFTIIGTIFGNGNGHTTFNLPNLQKRFILNKTISTDNSTGSKGGTIHHTHTISHTHTVVIQLENAKVLLNLGQTGVNNT